MVHIVRVTPELLTEWFSKGNEIKVRVKEGLPKGVELVDVRYKRGSKGECRQEGVKYMEFWFVDEAESGSSIEDTVVQFETIKGEEEYVPFLTK